MVAEVLDKAAQFIEADPKGTQALLLYALISTLSIEKSGCLFKLAKLKEMEPGTRSLAYDLMEHMARDGVGGPEWAGMLVRVNEAVRDS